MKSQPGLLPRRVVDVGMTQSSEPFLYETRGEFQHYAALSHCWKDSMPLKTKRSNLVHRQGRLFWDQLPVAFQECITIVRELGIRYLWIDSLCIVQDDPVEWAIESARMANIFENAYVTITMHQGGSNSSSIKEGLNFSLRHPFANERSKKVNFTLMKANNELEQDQTVESTKLSTRGWCFQVRPALRCKNCQNGL
jgi:hypothetical protein